MHPSTTPTTLPCYEPSGRVGIRAWAVWGLFGPVCAVAAGYLLSLAQGAAGGWFTSTVCVLLVMPLAAICFGLLADMSHSRSPVFNAVAASLLVALMLGARWAMTAWSGDSALFATDVAWQDRIAPGVGALLEALGVGGLAVFIARIRAQEPYSEVLGAWAADDMQGELWVTLVDRQDALTHLQNEGIGWLLSAPSAADLCLPQQSISSVWHTLKVKGKRVEGPSPAHWLNVEVGVHSRDSAGKIKTDTYPILQHWAISAQDYQAVKTHLILPQDPAVDAASCDDTGSVSDLERPTPKELEAALTALDADQFAVAYTLAHPHCQHPEETVRADAWRMCALAQARQHLWAESFDAYHALFEIEPGVLTALQLSTTSVMAGELLRGQAWFDKACELNEASAVMLPVELRLGFLSALEQAGEFEASRLHLDWLAARYQELRCTDWGLLIRHRLPPFEEFLRKADAMLRMVLSQEQHHEWFGQLRAGVDAPGQQAIDRYLTAA